MKWPDDFINKVICGDCLEVMKGIPDGAVDAVVTDPPYGMSYVSNRRAKAHSPITGDSDLTWFKGFAVSSSRVLANNTHLYVFCNDYAISDFRMLMNQSGLKAKRTLVWVKNNHSAGDLDGDYANKTEFVLYAHKGRRVLNGARCDNVLNFDRASTAWHPTEKPTSLMSFLIQKSTNPGDIIIDPYAGSGTTLVAAKQLGRKYIGIEIDPKYCEIARDRLRQEELSL